MVSAICGAAMIGAGSIGAGHQPAPVYTVGGTPQLPKGAPHRISAVAVMMTGQVITTGKPLIATDQDVVFVLRNNTGHPVHDIQAEAVVVDSVGRPLAEERDLGLAPDAVRSGGLAFGWFRFDSSGPPAFPAGAKLRIAATGSTGLPVRPIDLKVTGAHPSQIFAGITGTAVNSTGRRVEGPITVSYICFNPANHVTAFASDIRTDLDWALPNQRIALSETPTSWNSRALHASAGRPCARALVALTGIG
jgi:hypothetical protein